jgi:hypothetical protein
MGSRRKLGFLVRANWIASSSFSKTFCLRFAASRYFTTNFKCGWFASLPGTSLSPIVGEIAAVRGMALCIDRLHLFAPAGCDFGPIVKFGSQSVKHFP